MKDALARLFGIDPNSTGARLAEAQLEQDSSALETLILRRKEHFSDLGDFADSIGVRSEELIEFERDPIDFDLSFIRAYSHGLGVEVLHYVHVFDDDTVT